MPKQEVLLEEYRQLMESQRDNTRITYSWIGNIFLVLSSVLFIFGLTTDKWSQFTPAMFLGMLLAGVWIGLTHVFVRYIRERFDRIRVISKKLGIPPIQIPRARFSIAQTYVVMFATGYSIAWVIRLVWLIVK